MTRGGARPGAGRPKGQGRYQEATKPIRIPESMVGSVLAYVASKGHALPLYGCRVQAGFPSPADDHLAGALDLNEHLIAHPAATFLVRAAGESMLNAGIHPDDILIVDRSISPTSGKIIIAAVDGQLTVKRLLKKGAETFLMPENKAFKPIKITAENEVVIWGGRDACDTYPFWVGCNCTVICCWWGPYCFFFGLICWVWDSKMIARVG